MITKYKSHVQPLIAIIAQPFLLFHPNIITLFGLIFPFLFLYLLLHHLYTWSLLCCVGFAFDAIDGYVARKKGKVSAFGKLLDSTTDRIADAIFVSAFGFAHLLPWYLVISALISMYLISYIRARAEALHTNGDLPGGLMQRSERLVFLFISLLLFIIFPSFVVLTYNILSFAFIAFTLLNLLTIFQRLRMYSHVLQTV